MFKNEYLLTVDIKKRLSAGTPTFVQYDSATLLFRIYDNGKPFDLAGFTRAEVSHKRPDGVTVIGTGTVETDETGQKYIRYTYQGNEMHKEGYNETSLSVFSTDKKVSILPFRVQIVSDLRDVIVESSKEEVGILQDLIIQVESLVDQANNAVTVAEKASTDAAKAVIDANIAKDTAETAANEANTAKEGAILATQDAIDATNAANLAKTATETATTDAIQAKNDANDAAFNANEKAGLANTAATNANSKIGEINLKLTDVDTAIFNANKAKDDTLLAKTATETATANAITATNNANAKATLADEKATLANTAAQNADSKATLADEKASLADTAATNANNTKSELEAVLPNAQNLENVLSYSSTTQYKKNNIIEYNGSSYQALQDTIGNTPPTLPEKANLYWSLLAQRGIDGTGSVVSVNNVSPDINGNVDLGNISSDWVDITNKPNTYPPSVHLHEISDVTGLQEALDNAGTKDVATQLSDGLMSKLDKVKIDGIEDGANNYVHPISHPASIITQDTSNRMVTDIQIADWNSKETTTGSQDKANNAETNAKSYTDTELAKKVDKITGKGLSTEDYTSIEKTKLASIEEGANNYVHPDTHPASIIIQDANNRMLSDAKIAEFEAKETVEGAQSKADTAESNAKTHADNKIEVLSDEFSTNIQNVTQQLADKANDHEVRKKTNPITLNDLDGEALGIIQNGSGGTPINVLSIPRDGSVTREKTTFIRIGKNLFDKNKVTRGYTISPSSQEKPVANEGAFVSDYITVEPNTTYIGSYTLNIAFFDENKIFINYSGVVLGSSFTTPSNAHYLRFGTILSQLDILQLEKGSVRTEYEEYYEYLHNVKVKSVDEVENEVKSIRKVMDEIKKSKNLFNEYTVIKGVALSVSNGAETTNVDYYSSGFIEVDSNTNYTGSGLIFNVMMYDANKNFLTYKTKSSTNLFVTTTANTKFVRLSIHKSYYTQFQFEKGTTPTPYEPYKIEVLGEDIANINKKMIELKSPLTGKKILFLGDSNTHINTFVKQIGDSTGASTFNGGLSATLLSDFTKTNSNIWNQMHGCAIADAISTNNFTTLESLAVQVDSQTAGWYPTTFTKQLQNIKDACLDIGKLEYIVAMYGTNDVSRNNLALDDDPNSLNKSKWNGAINYFIKTIQTAHPHIKVYMVSPVFRANMSQSLEITGSVKNSDEWAQSLMLPAMVEAERERTKVNHIPFIDLYNESGINKYTATHYLKPYPDGTHFSTTGDSLVAEKITKGLLSK